MHQHTSQIVGETVFDDDMSDMVNLPREDTGLDGIIYVSTAHGAHAPRVKWYPGRPDRDGACLSVTLDTPQRVINHGLPLRVARQAEPAIVGWVEGNRAALLGFWHHGLSWTRQEVNAFVAGLARSD